MTEFLVFGGGPVDRGDFLEKYWDKYPTAPVGSTLLGEYLQSSVDKATVVARVGKSLSQLSWASDTLDISKDLLNEELILEQFSFKAIETVLVEGDLVVFRRERKNDGYQRSAMYLLAPRLGPTISSHASRLTLSQWSQFLEDTRRFFKYRNYLEVKTPQIVDSPGTEPTLNPFKIELVSGPDNQIKYLPTSPEFNLKKAWSLDLGNIFEIQNSFRNDELSEIHQFEFSMLEWYQALGSPEQVIDTLIELICKLAESLHFEVSQKDFEITSWKSLLQKVCQFELTPGTTKRELQELLDSQNIYYSKTDSWTDLFHRLSLEKIEPWLNELSRPVVVRDFPPEMRAFSRINKAGWADRFELYWQGLELCNGFHEVNSPSEQLERFIADQEDKIKLGMEVVPMDHQLIQALNSGMNPGTGVALGLDRLFMILANKRAIDETRLFPFTRN